MINIGFIGTGNMGGSIIKGLRKSKADVAINAFDLDKAKLETISKESNVAISLSISQLVRDSNIIIIAVKPNAVKDVLKECKEEFASDKILITIVVGIPIKFYKDILGDNIKVIRTMPNTPALVGEGMTVISCSSAVTEEDKRKAEGIFQCIGKVEFLDEKYMSEVTALTGSSPAYVFMFIEAMADAAVLSGIPRALSYRLASQAVLGSAKMVLETGLHPGELKDQVCSPSGTTIEAVASLEKHGFRYAVISAMEKCTQKALEIEKTFK